MYKKVFSGIVALFIIAVMALNVNFNVRNNGLSDVTLTNIEALAQGEGGNFTSCCGNNCSSWQDWDTGGWIGCGWALSSFCCYGR